MSQRKPVLKRSFYGSSSKKSPGTGAFLTALILLAILSIALYRAASPSSGSKTSVGSAQTSVKPPQKPATYHSNTPAAQTQALLTKIILEKDSSTYPGQAPRMPAPALPRPRPAPPHAVDWSKPSIALVIDDIGHEITYDRIMDYLGTRITYAILPHLRYSLFYADKGRRIGADVILHLPLESELGIYPGPGLITRFMSNEEVLHLVDENLRSVPHAIGANNHMGSLGTSDLRLMNVILNDFKKRNLFFLDSYTSVKSEVVPTAHNLHLPVLRRDVFLDNVEEPEAIRRQLREAAEVALKSGFSIAIGHYKRHTLEVIAEEIPKLEKEGFQIVKLSDLMKHYA